MSRYNNHPPQQPPFSPPAYHQAPYPPSPYGHQQYAQQHYGQNPYAPPPRYQQPHHAYPPSDPNQYPYYSDGYPPPPKKQKGNPVVTRYPQPNSYHQSPPPHAGYAPPAHHYPPQPPYPPQAQAIPPPPPPGWLPPPPPGWRGPVPPPQQPAYYPPAYAQPPHVQPAHVQPAPAAQPGYYAPHSPYGQDDPSNPQSPRNQHNQASHWNASHGQIRPGQRRFTSLQWKRSDQKDSKDGKDSTASATGKSASGKGDTPTPALSTTDAVSNSAGSQASPGSQSGKGSSHRPKTLGVKYDESGDFDYDNYFPDEDEEVDEHLSLGTIIWVPGEHVKRAIPAFYSEIDAVPPEPLTNGDDKNPDGVSMYTTAANIEEQSCPIQKSREWDEIKDDPIFVNLFDLGASIPMEQVVANRDRPALTPENMDVDEEEGEIRKEWNVLEDVQISLYAKPRSCHTNGYGGNASDDNDDLDDDDPYSPPPAPEKPPPIPKVESPPIAKAESREDLVEDAQSPYSPQSPQVKAETKQEAINDLPNDIEVEPERNSAPTALVTTEPEVAKDTQRPHSLPEKPASSGTLGVADPKQAVNQFPERSSLSKSPGLVRNQSQEDILAKLGVTGHPKPVRGTPGPAYNPPPPPPLPEEFPRANGNYTSAPHTPAPPVPPPPPMPREDSDIPAEEPSLWKSAFDGARDSSPKSQTSQRTQVGSDFHVEPEEEQQDDAHGDETQEAKEKSATPPNIGRNSLRSRKRTRTGSEEADDGIKRQKDDVTPRLRRRQPKVASAYGRRW